MLLPNYFLADLPPESPLQPGMVRDACETLKRNRARYLLPRSTESVIQTIVEIAKLWLNPYSPWRTLALEQGPAATGFSRPVLEAGLDSYMRLLTVRNLNAFVLQELGHPQRLDRFAANDAETMTGVSTCVRGPELLFHVTAGILPTPVFAGMIHGLLVRSAQFVKCASGSSFLPRLFAHTLRDVEPKLASCLEIAEWKGGAHSAEPVLFEEADCVIASGSDETMAALRKNLPSGRRFLAHGHRVSAGYITREALNPGEEQRTIEAAVADIVAWDQLGCLSPHVTYVETGAMVPPEGVAAKLAEELARVETTLPRGPVTEEVSSAIYRRRELYRLRAAADSSTRCWFSTDSTAWSVVYEEDGRFQLSCLYRFVYVKPVDTPEDCLHQAEAVRGQWSTLGLAAIGVRNTEVAQVFANWGVTRICPLGQMQRPPLNWRHDGRPALGDLVTWTSHELPLDV